MATAKTYLRDGVRYDRKTDKPFVAGVSPSEPASAGGPISTATLSGQADIKLPNPPAPTAAAGLQGAVTANADQFTKDLEQRRKEAEAAKNDSMGSLMEALGDQEGKIERTSKAYSREGVDSLEVELKDINQQILQEQEALRRSVERIQTAPGTATSAERDRAVRETERVSLRKQADLSIIQLARQGRYDSAKTIADRAVSAELEQQTQELDALKFIYSENKDLFTKAEDRQFQTLVADRERKLQNEEYRLRAEFDQKLKQADPLYQLQIQKTRKELSLMGQPSSKELQAMAAALSEAKAAVPVMQDKIQAVGILKEHPGMSSRVGANPLARGPQGILGTLGRGIGLVGLPGLADAAADTATGSGQAFSGGVHKLVGGLTLDNLISAKARGATFGALSDSELQILANSASSINDWEIKDGKGKGTGFWDVDEATFKKELDTIKELTSRAIEQSGGSLIATDEQDLLDELYKGAQTPANFYD